MRVLHVEHDADNVHAVQSALGRSSAAGATTDVAATPRLAVARLDAGPTYDVVLTALDFPDGDGLELVDHIRRRGLDVAIVVKTPPGQDEVALRALKAGADDYVVLRDGYLRRLSAVLHDAHRRFHDESARRARGVRVLYAEDEPDDVTLTTIHLERCAPHIRVDAVRSASELLARLAAGTATYDLLLLDYALPGMNALEILKHLRQAEGIDVPVVVVTGQGDEDVALQALKLGASDYLVKSPGYLQHLVPAVHHAVLRRDLQTQEATVRQHERRLHAMIRELPDCAMYLLDRDGRVVDWTSGAEQVFGHRAEAIRGESAQQLYPTDGALRAHLDAASAGRFEHETWLVRKNGARFRAHVVLNRVPGKPGGGPTHFSVVVRDTTERRRLEQAHEALLRELRDANEQWRLSTRRLIAAHEAERRLVAGSLHDEVHQALVAVKLRLDAVETTSDPGHRATALADCFTAVDAATARVRGLSFDLRPEMLDDLGLLATLRWYLARTLEPAGVAWELDAKDVAAEASPTTDVDCFRVVQEAVRNVVAHADASCVRVELRTAVDGIAIDVRDDGHGFDAEQWQRTGAPPTGGLFLLQQRAAASGGSFSVRSHVGGGTHLHALVRRVATDE